MTETNNKNTESRDGGKILATALRILLPLGLTILLLWVLFRKVNFHDMMEIISDGVDYGWILLGMFLSIFSHIFRAARWRLQLDAMDIRPPFMAICCSIFGCYALNLVFPRLGEVWRCTYIAKKEKAPLTKVIGSMVSDRLVDMLTALCILLLTFILAAPALRAFAEKYPVGRDLVGLMSNPVVWIASAAGVIVTGGLVYLLRNNAFIRKIIKWVGELWEGFASVIKMRGRGKFLMYTLLLWGCYYIQLYVTFFAFPFTARLCTEPGLGFGLLPCLVAFILSTFGMAVPSNGGLGPWNIAVMFGLAVYGITDAQGTAFSMLVWSGETVMLILLGIFTLGYIAVGKRDNRTVTG